MPQGILNKKYTGEYKQMIVECLLFLLPVFFDMVWYVAKQKRAILW